MTGGMEKKALIWAIQSAGGNFDCFGNAHSGEPPRPIAPGGKTAWAPDQKDTLPPNSSCTSLSSAFVSR